MRSDRRYFLHSAVVGLAFLATKPVALAAGGDAKLAARYYDDAVTMLKNGHWYERAIGKLTYCAQTSPGNSAYHAALGCAYASRFASLCEAYINRDRKTMSPQEADAFMAKIVGKIKSGELTAENAEKEMPDLPKISSGTPPLHTADDNKYLTLSKDELVGKLRVLAANAETAWDKSVSTASNDTERRGALGAAVWGYQLLRLSGSHSVQGKPAFSLPDKQAEGFQENAELAALELTKKFGGEAESHLLLCEVLTPIGSQKGESADKRLQPTYERALQLDPSNSAVVLRMYQLAKADKARQSEAEKHLRRFVELQPGNAYAHFFLAGFLAEQIAGQSPIKSPEDKVLREKIENVVRIVAKGQLCAKFIIPTTLAEPPAMYRAALAPFLSEVNSGATCPKELNDLASLLTLSAQGYADTDFEFAKRCAYMLLGNGKRITAYLQLTDELMPENRVGESMLELFGSMQMRVAYKDLLTLYRKKGNKKEYDSIKRERDEYVASIEQKNKKYLARILSSSGN